MKNLSLKKLLTFFLALGTPYPLRDWLIVLGIIVVLGAGLASSAAYFFFGLETGAIIEARADAVSRGPSVSLEALKNAVAAYEARALNFESGNINSANLPDPR
jgi:hypothetical protein